MARTQDGDISDSSKQIIEFLHKKYTTGQLVKLGYSESTVRYYKRKLFNPEKYQKVLKKARVNNRKK